MTAGRKRRKVAMKIEFPYKEHRYFYKKIPGVVSIGIGRKVVRGEVTDEIGICFGVVKKLPSQQVPSKYLIPPLVAGIVTDVWEVGVLKVLPVVQEFSDRYRPAPGGVSVGHKDITAGTLGCLCKKDGRVCILSNNHVLANSNAGEIGDSIFQPGPYDGGSEADTIARLYHYEPIKFNQTPIPPVPPCKPSKIFQTTANWILKWFSSWRLGFYPSEEQQVNYIDAALAEVEDTSLVTPEIREIGTIAGVVELALGMPVKKSGRTTEVTTDKIEQVDVSCTVQYGGGRSAYFEDQLMAGAMSKGGDSGSVVLNNDNFIGGLLFAGSDTQTVINRIQNVIDILGIEAFLYGGYNS